MNPSLSQLGSLSAEARRALLEKLLREKAEQAEIVSLSYAQHRLWFLDQMEPDSCLYNLPVVLRLEGPLQTEALQRALQEIVNRHEILRTTFVGNGEGPIQVIAVRQILEVPVVQVSAADGLTLEGEIDRLVGQAIRQPFNLARGPVIRALLLRLNPEWHVLALTLHHIVCDTWSLNILLRELAALYEAFAADQRPALPELPVQYADFALWQQRHLRGAVLEKQLAYWMRQLEGLTQMLELPTDRPRPAVQTYQGAHQAFVLTRSLTDALKALSRRENVTLFMTLLALFKTLLHRCSGQDDIVVGTPVANRTRREIEPLIGFFSNTLVLRTQVRSDLPFRQFLGGVRQTALEAYDQQDLPFEKLVETLQPERTLSHNPLFQVMLILQNGLPQSLTMGGLGVSRMEVHTGTAKFDLTLSLFEDSRGLGGELEYNTDIFEAQTAARFLSQFQTLAESVVANPDCPIAELPILSASERRRIVFEWNQTQSDFSRGRCLHELFESQAAATPEAVAVVFQHERLTYRELNARASRMADHLRSVGVGTEVIVGLCVEPSVGMVVGMLGILKAGGVYLPLDPSYPKARLAFALADSQAPVLVTKSKQLARLPDHPARVICLDSLEAEWAEAPAAVLRAESSDPARTCVPAAESLAYVIYTSGSTGKPKGVCITHRNAVALVSWARGVYGPEELQGVLAATSMCFDLSVFEVFVPLSAGGKVILAENLFQLPALPAADEVTLINSVPSVMAELLRLGKVPASVRTVNLAGEPLPAKLVRQIHENTSAQRVYDLYGPTEDTVYSTAALREKDGPTTIGRPVSNEQVYLLDARLQPVPVGVPGELCLSGEGLGRGYLNRPQLSAEKFIPNPFSAIPGGRLYRTGDLARYLPDGRIEFLGRKDHQIKLRGYRIELGEIEATLLQHPTIRECLPMVQELKAGEKILVAYLVFEENESTDAEALRRFVAERLPVYMVPGAFVFLEALPRTPNGKVDRRALPLPNAGRTGVEARYLAPRTATERILADIWSAVLGIEQIGVHDNFFELGGHSLLVTRVISRVRAAFELEVPIRCLFEAPTIALFAGVLEQLLLQDIAVHDLAPQEV